MYVYVSETELCSYTQCMLKKLNQRHQQKRDVCVCVCVHMCLCEMKVLSIKSRKKEKIEISSLRIPATQKLESALTFYEIKFFLLPHTSTRAHMYTYCTNSLMLCTNVHNADMEDLKTSEYVMLNLLDVALQTYDDVNNSEMKIGRRNWRRRQREWTGEGAASRDWVRFKKKNERLRTCANTNWSSADFSIFHSFCYFFFFFFSFLFVFESLHTYTHTYSETKNWRWNFLDVCATKTSP